MAFYPPYQTYYYPMPYPGQEFYPMYPPNPMDANGAVYYEPPPQMPPMSNNNNGGLPYNSIKARPDKFGYNNRKESQDSGISDYSNESSSRKTSNTSTISNVSSIAEESGLDDVKEEDSPYESPEDDLCVQIVQQVEFYFSDANISKDKFLLKHVKRNKEGFVSLKLISSFKRIKHLTKDWRQVAEAIERKSTKLEVNDVKTKVRRLQALPEYDETTPSRTVIALNMPIERPTIESVAELFSSCGEIVLIRVLRPGNPIPADVRPFVNKHPEVTSRVCALIEFERTEFAHKAVRQFNHEDENKMKVFELIAPPPLKNGKKTDEKRKLSLTKPNGYTSPVQQPQRRYSQGMAPAGLSAHNNMDSSARRKISLYSNMKFPSIAEERQKMGNNLNPNAPVFTMQQQQQQRRFSRSSQPPAVQSGPSAAAWMSRRISGQLDYAASGLTLPPNVVRQPRGPDNTNGFQKWCRARMISNSSSNSDDKSEGSLNVEDASPPAIEVSPVVVIADDSDTMSSDNDEDDDAGISSNNDEDEDGEEAAAERRFANHNFLSVDMRFEDERRR